MGAFLMVKAPVMQHEDWSSGSQNPHKHWVGVEATCNPSAWEEETQNQSLPRASWLARLGL